MPSGYQQEQRDNACGQQAIHGKPIVRCAADVFCTVAETNLTCIGQLSFFQTCISYDLETGVACLGHSSHSTQLHAGVLEFGEFGTQLQSKGDITNLHIHGAGGASAHANAVRRPANLGSRRCNKIYCALGASRRCNKAYSSIRIAGDMVSRHIAAGPSAPAFPAPGGP